MKALLALWWDIICPLWENAGPSHLDRLDGIGQTADPKPREVVLPRNL